MEFRKPAQINTRRIIHWTVMVFLMYHHVCCRRVACIKVHTWLSSCLNVPLICRRIWLLKWVHFTWCAKVGLKESFFHGSSSGDLRFALWSCASSCYRLKNHWMFLYCILLHCIAWVFACVSVLISVKKYAVATSSRYRFGRRRSEE